MGPVTESEKQKHDYTHKVNEMQKFLPYLEQRITNTTLPEENNEELQKLKILQRVLCGQEAVDDSLTLEELDKYAVLLHNDKTKSLAPALTLTLTPTAAFDRNSHGDKTITLSQAEKCGHKNGKNTASKENVETSELTSSETTTNEVENKVPVNEESLIQTQDKCKKNNEATGKENKCCEAFDTVNKNIENVDETLQNQNKSKSKFFEEDTLTVAHEKPIKEYASESAELTNDCAKFDETGENTLNNKETDVLKPKAISKLETSDTFNKIKEIVKESGEGENPIEHKKLITEDVEELEYEGIELIKIPEETVENEMILPDSADEEEYVGHNSDDEEDKESKNAEDAGIEGEEELINCGVQNIVDKIQDENKTKAEQQVQCGKDSTFEQAQPTVDESSDTPTCSTEENTSLHVEFAIEIHTQIDNAPELEEITHIDDPLGQVDSTLEAVNLQISPGADAPSTVNSVKVSQAVFSGVKNVFTSPDDNDDDDVEIIESRNSPICLDTDDEDDTQVGKLLVDPTPNTTITQKFNDKINANKEKRIQGNKTTSQLPPTIKTTKSITETINLLDSSDEDEVNSSNANRRSNRRIIMPTVTRSVKISAVTAGKKRTLLPMSQAPKSLKVNKVCTRGSTTTAGRTLPSNTTAADGGVQNTTRSVILFPPTFKPTPQSNFLNAVNLLPAAATTGDNPPAFAATLSNKNIIIPNAFYANRRTTNSKEEEDDASTQGTSSTSTGSKTSPILITQQLGRRVYREWLEEFIENFADPQQIVSHSCLVLLQTALKYKVFLRIKDLRIALNNKAYTSNGTADAQLRREMYNAFYLNDCRLSGEGMRFCTAACTQIGNNVTLMTDARTGRITLRTSRYEELVAKYGGTNDVIDDKKKRNKYDEEYTPAKYYEKKVEESNTGQGERRKSLRQHRTRCYDETFLYEPEEADDDETPTAEKKAATDKRRQDEQMMALVQRKAEEKRLEAKRQREQQVKSFESAYLEMFAKSLRGKNGKTAAAMTSGVSSQSRSKNVFTDFTSTSTNSQIVIDDDDEQGLEDDEPRSHRIYKVVPTRLLAAPKHTERPTIVIEDEDAPRPKRGRPRKQDLTNVKMQPKQSDPELITCDSTSGDSTSIDDELLIQPDEKVPKNVDANWHAGSDWCKICNKRFPRTVSHYVNEHPDSEVFISRLPKAVLARVRKQGGQILEMRPYMNGQEQYAAECVFCNKTCCFKIPYWYQHFSMHTGEYAFRCSGCNTRKTTRSAMMGHINQPCRKRGKLLEDYIYNARARQIEMRVCKICNYMQLNRRNVMKHLRTQHGLTPLPAKHIYSVILLRLPHTEMDKVHVDNELMDLSSGADENSSQMAMTFNYDNFNDVDQTGFWDDGDPDPDDLSYMICGMLDVELKHSDE
uniref:Uncharacterized protein n=1 Tax=Bactrocera latifrons TaxID=174628 RepID=A0A0K8V8D8_BACLA